MIAPTRPAPCPKPRYPYGGGDRAVRGSVGGSSTALMDEWIRNVGTTADIPVMIPILWTLMKDDGL